MSDSAQQLNCAEFQIMLVTKHILSIVLLVRKLLQENQFLVQNRYFNNGDFAVKSMTRIFFYFTFGCVDGCFIRFIVFFLGLFLKESWSNPEMNL